MVLFFLLAFMALGVHSDFLSEDSVSILPHFKFHPGLWSTGAGRKRLAPAMHSPHISTGVLTNMRKFFDDVREDIEMRTRNTDDYDTSAYSPVKNEIADYNKGFSTNRGTRKGSLNPSLLWKGLGRK